jgi:hypothetical protein
MIGLWLILYLQRDDGTSPESDAVWRSVVDVANESSDEDQEH